MKATSAQIFNAAITLMANLGTNSIDDESIKMYIDLAQRTAALVPEVDNMPSDDEIREAMQQIMNEGEVGAMLLTDSIIRRFGINRYSSYAVIQRALQLGMIKGTPVSQNKVVYSLIK